MQEFSDDYHVVLTERISHMSPVANGGSWIEFSHFETHMAFTVGRKISCYAVETIFLACVF